MPTYILEGAVHVDLTPGPLTLSMSLEGPTTEALLEAVVAGQRVDSVLRPRPGLMIVPRIDAVLTVRVVPLGIERFPPGTTANVSVTVNDAQNGDPERAVLIPIDLSGLTNRDLFVFERTANHIQVRAARVLPPSADLGALGNAARIAATEILGVQALDEVIAVNVVAALDGSASFASLIEDDSADAILRVLAGICEVVAAGKRVSGAILGSRPAPVAVRGADDLADAMVTTWVQHPLSVGLRSRGEASVVSPGTTTVTYVITDAVPADLDAWDSAAPTGGGLHHLVVLGTQAAWRLQSTSRIPSTLVEISPGETLLGVSLLAHPQILRELVTSLMAGYFEPGTSTFERVTP